MTDIERYNLDRYGEALRVAKDTTLEAWKAIQPYLSDIEALVVNDIGSQNGQTCDEIEASRGMRHQTISSRITALAKAGLIKDSGIRKNTRSGRPAIVWVMAW